MPGTKDIFFPLQCTVLLCVIMYLSFICKGEKYDSIVGKPSQQLMEEGRIYFEHRDAEKALARFMLVAEQGISGNKEQKEQRIRALNNIGCVYKYFFYDYSQAYDYFTSAREECEKANYYSFLPVILVNLGDLLNDYGVHYNSESFINESEQIFKECFQISYENKNWPLMTTAFYNLSNGNYDLGLKDYLLLFSKEIPEDTPDLEYVRLQYKGLESLQKGHYEEARKYFRKQLDVVSTTVEPLRDTLSAYNHIAETYNRTQDYEKASEWLKEALSKAENANMKEISADIASQLAACYKNLGVQDSVEKYNLLYLQNREDLHNAHLGNVGELKYISDLKKEEIKLKEMSFRQKYLGFLIIGLIIIVLSLSFLGYTIWKKNKVLDNRNRSLYEKYRQLLTNGYIKTDKYQQSNLKDEKRLSLLSKIKEIMADPGAICRPDFTLKDLATLVDSNTSYVSQIINETYGFSFSTLLGNSRVRFFCQNFNEGKTYNRITIEGIAHSVGFKSRTAFINAFKREVGMTPSEYIKAAKN